MDTPQFPMGNFPQKSGQSVGTFYTMEQAQQIAQFSAHFTRLFGQQVTKGQIQSALITLAFQREDLEDQLADQLRKTVKSKEVTKAAQLIGNLSAEDKKALLALLAGGEEDN
jgi:hypothetical protein